MTWPGAECRHRVPTPCDGRGDGLIETQMVSERTERVQPYMGHHPRPTRFHNDPTSAITVHLEVPFSSGITGVSTRPLTGRAFPLTRPSQIK